MYRKIGFKIETNPRNRDKFWFKMEAEEYPELTSAHKHTASIATLGRTLTTSGATSPTLKQVGVAETQFTPKLTPDQWGTVERDPKTQSFPLRSKWLKLHLRHPQLLRPAPEKEAPTTYSFENKWVWHPQNPDPQTSAVWKKMAPRGLEPTHPRVQCRSDLSKGTQTWCGRRWSVCLRALAWGRHLSSHTLGPAEI